jgi:hypothetical protein
MSTYDDASLIYYPSGYKAGKAYSLKPIPYLGSEKVVNGDFATDTNWTKGTGWTISGGKANCDGSQTSTSSVYQNAGLTIGAAYKVIVTISNYSAGNIRILMGGNTFGEWVNSNGEKTFILVQSFDQRIYVQADANFVGSIDNVSVKEVIDDGDLDFTRASSATRVNSDGLIETASVLGSELIVNGDFATNLDSWSTSSWWVWNSLGAYHPSTSSHKPLYQQCCVIGKTYLITFDLNCVGSSQAKFSLGSSLGVTTQVIGTSLTTGSYSYYVTAAAEYIVFNRQNTAEYYVNNVSVKEVITLNVPRIDYTGGGCGKLLLEPQRTNLFTYSEQFDNAAWTKSGATITANATTSPDGTTNADSFIGNGSNAEHSILQSLSFIGGTTYTISFYAKKNTNNFIQVVGASSAFGANVWANFDLNSGVVGSVGSSTTASIQNVGDGWYRCTAIAAAIATTSTNIVMFLINSSTSSRAESNSLSTSVYLYGAQTESGSYSTSLINTSGTAVTRVKDAASKTGISSLINSTEGVLYAEIAALADDGTNRFMTLSDGTNDNRVLFGYRAVTNQIFARIEGNNSASVDLEYISLDTTLNSKVAISYDSSFNYKMYVNGLLVDSGIGTDSIIGLDRLDFANAIGTENFYGNVQSLMVFPTVLSDDDLTLLTGTLGETYFESYALMANYLNYTIQ